MTGLEALEKFDKLVKKYNEKIGLNENDLLGFGLSLKIIEKELKALEIIRKKHFVVRKWDKQKGGWLNVGGVTCSPLDNNFPKNEKLLNCEESKILKEVFEK